MCVHVKPGIRTAAAVSWEAAAKTSLLVLALSLLDRRCCSSVYCSSTGCFSSTCCCCCCCCGRCSSTRRWWSTGSHPTRSLVEQNCLSSGYWLCVSHGPKAAVPRNPDEKKQLKTTMKVKNHVSACTCTFKYGTTHGPARQIHGQAHVNIGPAHTRVEPVSHGPCCHVMGRAGPGPDF